MSMMYNEYNESNEVANMARLAPDKQTRCVMHITIPMQDVESISRWPVGQETIDADELYKGCVVQLKGTIPFIFVPEDCNIYLNEPNIVIER